MKTRTKNDIIETSSFARDLDYTIRLLQVARRENRVKRFKSFVKKIFTNPFSK